MTLIEETYSASLGQPERKEEDLKVAVERAFERNITVLVIFKDQTVVIDPQQVLAGLLTLKHDENRT